MYSAKKLVNPIRFVIAVNLIAYAILYFYRKPYDNKILLVAALTIILSYAAYFLIIKLKLGDELLFPITAMLFSLGIIMLYRLDPYYGMRQIVWLTCGIVVFFAACFIYRKFRQWSDLIYVYLAASVILFLATLVFGSNIQGATNWIMFGNVGFQTSEIIKLLYIFFLAAYYARQDRSNLYLPAKLTQRFVGNKIIGFFINLPERYYLMAITYFYMLMLVLQRELGTVLLLMMIYFVFIYIMETDWKFMFFNAALALTGAFCAVLLLSHVQIRVDAWLNPWADIANKGYQITQSLFAIGSGGFFGTGLGLGSPEYIPEVHTDFIFSAICEELGIFGGIAIVLLYFILIYRGLKITLKLKEPFRKNIALGLTIMIGFQTFIIIGGVIKLIPMTGITLPFVSYGGSSMLISFATLGILQASSMLYSEHPKEPGQKSAKRFFLRRQRTKKEDEDVQQSVREQE